jgi:hypothetical protein
MSGHGRQRPSACCPRGHGAMVTVVTTPPLLASWTERLWAVAQAGPARLFSCARSQAENHIRPVGFTGRPVCDKKNGFSFFFYYLKIEMVWKMFDYSNLLQIY